VTGALLVDAVSLPPDCSGSGPAQLENTMSPTYHRRQSTAARKDVERQDPHAGFLSNRMQTAMTQIQKRL
jgi:hypothetical protein